MLMVTRNITISGVSEVDGKEVCRFQATINSENPRHPNFSSWQINKDLYKENRAECRADEAAFEDHCYAVADEMMAEVVGGTPDEN